MTHIVCHSRYLKAKLVLLLFPFGRLLDVNRKKTHPSSEHFICHGCIISFNYHIGSRS